MELPRLDSGATCRIRPGDGFDCHAFGHAANAVRGRRDKMDKHNSQNGAICEDGHRNIVQCRRTLFYRSFTEALLRG